MSPTLRLRGVGGGVEDGPSSSLKRCLLLGKAMEVVVMVEVVGFSFRQVIGSREDKHLAYD
jgi:hypothetical protein